jgi:hypothetical protein
MAFHFCAIFAAYATHVVAVGGVVSPPPSPPFGHGMLTEFALEAGYVNLNHGSYGSTPRSVTAEAAAWTSICEANPDKFYRFDKPDGGTMWQSYEVLRQRLVRPCTLVLACSLIHEHCARGVTVHSHARALALTILANTCLHHASLLHPVRPNSTLHSGDCAHSAAADDDHALAPMNTSQLQSSITVARSYVPVHSCVEVNIRSVDAHTITTHAHSIIALTHARHAHHARRLGTLAVVQTTLS